MANQNFYLFLLVSLLLVSTIIPLGCDSTESDDENSKIHIVYMGSLPEETYFPTSHHLNMLQQVIDKSNATNHLVRSYKKSFNGFAAKLNNQQREKIASMDGVVSVFPSKTFSLQTTRSWDFLGLSKSIKRQQTIESDIVIGVIDSGIWPESESFRDEGLGPIPKKWKGVCAGGKNFSCNKKIIGARWYDSYKTNDDTARDGKGHGTHTASTVGGREVNNVSFYGLANGTATGGVPSSRIAVYKVCHTNPSAGCNEADILSAFDDAIADGVDIITISIGFNKALDFLRDTINIGSFHAMVNGILTVQAAGNYGPSLSSTGSAAPWILSVAASTIDRSFIDKVILGNGNTFVGKSVNYVISNGTKFPIAVHNFEGNHDEKECPSESYDRCDCVDEKSVKGKIVLCASSMGEDKTAFEKGAIGSITKTFDNDPKNYAQVTYYPSLKLDSRDYILVQSYTNATKDPHAEILKSEIVEDFNAPRIANFSSRGPNSLVPEILKPDISAPGVEILASYSLQVPPSKYPNDTRHVKYNIISGTSMACPHVAGVAAYVKSFHPNWLPAAIKSAIMTTAKSVNGTYDLAGEFAYGSGNVNPIQAINPGLVYDMSKVDYVQMLCNYGYDANKIILIGGGNSTCHGTSNRSLIKDLNYPALVIHVEPLKPFNVKIHRTVTNVGFYNSTYKAIVSPNSKINITVIPSILSFKSINEKQSFIVNVVGRAKSNETAFSSSLVWSDGFHNVKSPIIVL